MRFATYRPHRGRPGTQDRAVAGVVDDGRVFGLPDGLTVNRLVELGLPQALEVGRAARAVGVGVPLEDVVLEVPLRPASVRDFVTFEEHVEGVRRSIEGSPGVPDAWYDAPTFYFTSPHALVASGAEVVVPAATRALDFELEVAVVVGADPATGAPRGRSLTVQQARDRVFGYTVLNDWSARDLQRREMQVGLGPAKGKDFASTLGPWIVTADELTGCHDTDGFLQLDCAVAVNGERVGRDVLANMGWTFETMVAYASRDSWVVAGDVLGSGTTGNGGCLAELWGRAGATEPPALTAGDEVTLTVAGIGTVTNRIVVGEPAPALPPVRRRDHAAARAAARADDGLPAAR